MAVSRLLTAACAAGLGLMLSFQAGRAAAPDTNLGDVAAEDVVTPVRLTVLDPEATQALQQRVAEQVHFIVRVTPGTADEAERTLRQTVAAARQDFVATLHRLGAGAAQPGAPTFTKAVLEVAGRSVPDLPIGELAPLWAKGASDEALVSALILPLRQAMTQPIVANPAEDPVPANTLVRLLPVADPDAAPTAAELDSGGKVVPSGRVISLWRAQRLVETYFPDEQEDLGKFAASFVRANAYPDPHLTAVLRARRIEGVAVNDTYEAGEVVIRKGQVIDRKAESALAELRKESLIGVLQARLDQQRSVTVELKSQTKWIVAGLAVVAAVLGAILWRLRARPKVTLLPVPADGGLGGWPPGDGDGSWRNRALAAETRAERAQAALRSGVLSWMREKVIQTLYRDRTELLSAQRRAAAEMMEFERRLKQVHAPWQQRVDAYERRIQELEREIAAVDEENRLLLGARIAAAREQLKVERERASSN